MEIRLEVKLTVDSKDPELWVVELVKRVLQNTTPPVWKVDSVRVIPSRF